MKDYTTNNLRNRLRRRKQFRVKDYQRQTAEALGDVRQMADTLFSKADRIKRDATSLAHDTFSFYAKMVSKYGQKR